MTIDKVTFGALTTPAQASMGKVQPLGPKAEFPAINPVAFGKSQPLEGMSMPAINPFGQLSPNVTNATQANKLPRLYA